MNDFDMFDRSRVPHKGRGPGYKPGSRQFILIEAMGASIRSFTVRIYIGEVWFFGLGGLTHGERGARTYNGGLGAVPPAGSLGRAPGGGSGGRSPSEAENFSCFGV